MTADTPRRGLPWGRLFAESALIVLSILLALAADAWREGRAESRRRTTALENVRSEITSNIAALEEVLPYHNEILERLGGILGDDHDQPGLAVLAGVAPRGLQTPDIRRTAWQTALSSGIVASFDYETTYTLSGLYDLQQLGVMTTIDRITTLLFSAELNDPSSVDVSLARLAVLANELARQEEYLLDRSRQTLAELDAEAT